MKFFRKKEKPTETTILKHYKVVFETVDNKTHEYNNCNYIDENTISCDFLSYYLSEVGNYLEDDKGVKYPISNIIFIKAKHNDTVNKVKKKTTVDGDYTWYKIKDIEF